MPQLGPDAKAITNSLDRLTKAIQDLSREVKKANVATNNITQIFSGDEDGSKPEPFDLQDTHSDNPK